MAFPFLAAAAGAQVVGGVLGAVGQLKQGNEALRNAKTEANLIGFNLQVAQVESRQRVRDINRQFDALLGQQVARTGKSGVTSSGSSLLINLELRREQRLATLREEFALDVQERIAPFQQSEIIRAGKKAKEAAIFGAIGSVLGAGGQAAGTLSRR